jgi:CubicO group peptidase (beta-lactamase class C family)
MTAAFNRREFLVWGARATAVVSAGQFFAIESYARTDESKYADVFGQLDGFVQQYMSDMNAPGMTVVLADRSGVQRVVTYGFSDVEQRTRVKPEELFHIGSISKSFVANCLLQLNQEGKLDLHKPVLEYLPWLRIESSFAPITTHHMLTHTSGLPTDAPVFLSDPAAKHRAANPPGQYFHYSNLCFEVLGHLLWTLDGRSLPDSIRARILQPLGMTESVPAISLDERGRTAKSYSAFFSDRPYPRNGPLCEAPGIIMTVAGGCVAATAHEMGLYIQMIANHGQGPHGRLLKEEQFALFSTPHIKAEEFGPTAGYGYGIAVDTLDGHKIVRHTGGMVSFASAIHVDLDEGVGAFASINAMQGYRPNPVAQYAIRLMRAHNESKQLPAPAPVNPPTQIENASDYVGTFQSSDGRKMEFAAEGAKLFLLYKESRVPVETDSGGNFIARHADFERFALVFGRADNKNPKSAVVEVGWGGDGFINSRYSGPTKFDYPKQWDSYVGHYRNDSPWIGSMHIVLRKGKLMIDGIAILEARNEAEFYPLDEEHSPEWIRFGAIVNGKAMQVKVSGENLWRVITP